MSFKADYVDADAGKMANVQLEDGEQTNHGGEFVPPVHSICYRTHLDWPGNARATGSHAVARFRGIGVWKRGAGGGRESEWCCRPGQQSPRGSKLRGKINTLI